MRELSSRYFVVFGSAFTDHGKTIVSRMMLVLDDRYITDETERYRCQRQTRHVGQLPAGQGSSPLTLRARADEHWSDGVRGCPSGFVHGD